MGVLLVRSLVLGCGLLLALPAGWCCLVPTQRIDKHQRPAAPPCCTKKSERHPTPTQPARPVRDCCCAEHLTTAPADLKAFHPDQAVSVALILPTAGAAGVLAGPEAASPSHSSRPLQMLLCVWRC